MMMTVLPQPLTPSKHKFWKLKEWSIKIEDDKLKEWTQKMKEWTRKMKEWKMMPYLMSKKDIAYGILPPSTTMMEDPIGTTLDGPI